MKLVTLISLQNSIFENNCQNQKKLYNPSIRSGILFLYYFQMIVFSPQKSFSHTLIVFCFIIAILGFLFPDLVTRFGLSTWYIASGDYVSLLVQILLFQFLHWGILHLLANSYFLYTAWVEVEARMSSTWYTWFFISTTIAVALALLVLQPYAITIGISGWCMALLSYLWIDLYTTRHPMASQILTMLVMNIAIWFIPGISLVGHLFGAIWWIIWWAIFRNWRQ